MENKTYPDKKIKLVKQMYHIFICDDDLDYLAYLKRQVELIAHKNHYEFRIYLFSSMEQISDQLIKTCDIAILDIDFKNKEYSGLDIAKRLRQFRTDSVIIFATNFIEYAPEGYEVQAFRYVLKHSISAKLENYINQAMSLLKSECESIKFQINGEIVDIALNRILFIEAQLHTVKVYVQIPNKKNPKEYSFYCSIGKLEQQLSERGFIRIHKSYLVNMEHIKSYQCKSLELHNGIKIKASANRYSEQKEKYLLWKGQVLNG